MTKFVTITCWCVAALALIGLSAWFLLGSPFGIGSNGVLSIGFGNVGWQNLSGPYELSGTYSVGTGGVDSLLIDWVAGDVTVKPYDGDEITLKEYAQRELEEDERLRFKISGSTLTVVFYDGTWMKNMPPKRLEVFLPAKLCANLENFTAGSTSGAIFINDVGAGMFSVDTVSGDLDIKNVSARTIEAESTSGRILISGAEADEITLESVSGTISLSDAVCHSLNADSTSGSQIHSGEFNEVSLESVSGTLTLNNTAEKSHVYTDSTSGAQKLTGNFIVCDIESISGNINITSTCVPDKVKTDTTSADVTLTLPSSAQITVRHSTTSGKLTSDIPMLLSDNAQLSFTSTSGDVHILPLP